MATGVRSVRRTGSGKTTVVATDESSKILIGIGWDPEGGARTMDIDSAVVVAGGGECEVVYFGNLSHPSGCVVHHGDDLTGAASDGGDDERITVYPSKIPYDRNKLIFVLNIYDCYEKDQTFEDVKNMYIRIYDPKENKLLAEYRVDSVDKHDTAVVIAALKRKDREWVFEPIGKGEQAADIHDLAICAAKKY